MMFLLIVGCLIFTAAQFELVYEYKGKYLIPIALVIFTGYFFLGGYTFIYFIKSELKIEKAEPAKYKQIEGSIYRKIN